MKKYFIIPIVQTEGMYGYTAIAIEITMSNILQILKLQSTFKKVKEIDSNIQDLTYFFLGLDFYLLNEKYTRNFEEVSIDSISDADLNEYQEEMECSVDSPHIIVSSGSFKILYPAKYSDSSLDGTMYYGELETLVSQLIE